MKAASPRPRLRLALAASCLFMAAAAGAAPPISDTERAAQRDPSTARHQPEPSKASDERAADALNQRDERKAQERSEQGDRTLQRADKVTRESKPDPNQPTDRPSQLSPHPQ